MTENRSHGNKRASNRYSTMSRRNRMIFNNKIQVRYEESSKCIRRIRTTSNLRHSRYYRVLLQQTCSCKYRVYCYHGNSPSKCEEDL